MFLDDDGDDDDDRGAPESGCGREMFRRNTEL